MPSKITKTDQGLAITGKLVFANSSDLSKQGEQIIFDSKRNELEIDCHEMQRIDSAGIALLLHWQRKSKQANKVCRFLGLNGQAKSLIQAYRLQTVIAI